MAAIFLSSLVIQHFVLWITFCKSKLPVTVPVLLLAHVLQSFDKKDQEEVDIAVQEGIDIVRTILTHQDTEKALSGVRSP